MATLKLGLALELRPKSLDEIIGQDSIKPAIQNFIDQDCRHWLFSGPTGAGKTTLARIVAREIQGMDFPLDLEPAILDINAADESGKDDIRELASMAAYSPLIGKYKVIILDECHKLSDGAKTSLLKHLENENTRAVWILCTTEPDKLTKALRDRCTAQFQLKEMGARERRALVSRAAAHLNYKGDLTKFITALDEKEVGSAREVNSAFERLCNGVPARIAVGLD